MSFSSILLFVLAVGSLVAMPLIMGWSLLDHLRGRGSDRRGGGGVSSGVGAAMQELDRIMTRPSVEHQIEAERQTLKREDDAGGD